MSSWLQVTVSGMSLSYLNPNFTLDVFYDSDENQ